MDYKISEKRNLLEKDLISPIYNEEFQIAEVRLRGTKPYKIGRSFQDATMGPFDSYAIGTIRLIDTDGNWGEVPTFTSNLYFYEKFILPPLLNAGRLTYRDLYKRLYWSIRNEGFRGSISTALGQLDYALYDLAARRNGMALNRYLGAERNWALAYASGGAIHWKISDVIDESLAFIDQGFETIKIKVGLDWGKSIHDDVKRLRVIRDAIGYDVGLAVDANQVFSVDEALLFAESIEDLNISWFEEPTHSADLLAIEEICQKSPIPISYGESEKTDKLFTALVRAGVSHLQPITGYLSSIEEWLNVMHLADRHGLMFSSGGFPHMNCQMISVGNEKMSTEILMALNGTLVPFFEQSPKLEGGKFIIPDSIGSALSIDWDYVKGKNLLAIDKTWSYQDFKNHIQNVN